MEKGKEDEEEKKLTEKRRSWPVSSSLTPPWSAAADVSPSRLTCMCRCVRRLRCAELVLIAMLQLALHECIHALHVLDLCPAHRGEGMITN